jgi:hypothetical protein
MYKYQAPGVYREEVFPKPRPGLLTGVPAFVGFAQRGNINEPQELSLFNQFEDTFGTAIAGSYLYDAVEGFFQNGGTLCYIIRLQEVQNPQSQSEVLNVLNQGLAALDGLDTIDLVCVPDIMVWGEKLDWVTKMQQAVLSHCEEMGDRFAILDSVNVAKVEEIQQQLQSLQSSYGALYTPWIKVRDTSQPPFGFVPPCGHLAGIYARSDGEGGVHQAPANYEIEGALDVGIRLSNTDQVSLNSSHTQPGVNCIRAFTGRGIRVWGAYTLSNDSQWHYLNVRRLFINMSRWIELNLSSVAFEPNNFKLWVRIERELYAYCSTLFQQGALKGSNAQEAFYVKCDSETNPPAILDQGMVVTEIGLAPTIPSEFLVVRLIHNSDGIAIQ